MPVGTLLNIAGILLGGVFGKLRPRWLTPQREAVFKTLLGVAAVWFGLRLTWISLHGPAFSALKQLAIAVGAMMLGKLLGQLCRVQELSNRLGQRARERIAAAAAGKAGPGDGFKTCAELFCAAPLGLIGALTDGLSQYAYPLGIKGVMDGFATIGFVNLFGWNSLLAVLPLAALQGSVTLAGHFYLEPFLRAHNLLDPIHATAGLIIFAVALVILGLKKIELTEYLPSLAVAPALAWVLN